MHAHPAAQPEGHGRGRVAFAAVVRHHRQCAVPAGRPSSVADVRHRSSRCRRRGRAACQPVAAPAPGRSRGTVASNRRRPRSSRRSLPGLSMPGPPMRNRLIPKPRIPDRSDPMTNLVVKSTSAPPAPSIVRPPAPIPTRSETAQAALAARRGGAARADRIWLWPVEADRHHRRRHPGRDPEIRARRARCR